MKGFRSTGVLFVLVAALAGYTYYEFKHADEHAAVERGEMAAFRLKRDEIDTVKLTLQGVEIDLHKENDLWKMRKPVEDLAESSVIEGFLISTLGEKLKSFQSVEEARQVNWADYGLDPAPTLLELAGKGKSETLKVSGKAAYDGSFYVRQGDQLLLGSASLSQLASKQPGGFRSRKLWREADTTSVESVSIALSLDHAKGDYRVVHAGDKWTLEPKPAFAIDMTKIETWVGRWKDLMPNDFAAETLDETQKKEFLLVKPSLRAALNLKRADGTVVPWEFTAGQDKGEDVYAYTNQRSSIYKFAKSGLASLRVPAEYFRDGKNPFQFDVEKAHEVEIHGDKWRYIFVKGDAVWKIKGESKDQELDQDKLVQLFQNIRGLEAAEFSPAARNTKLSPRLIVRDGKGLEIFSLAWGEETHPVKPWNQGLKHRWVRTSLEKEFMSLPKEKLDMLISQDLVKKKDAMKEKLDVKPATEPKKK
jgi:hypothetical protein